MKAAPTAVQMDMKSADAREKRKAANSVGMTEETKGEMRAVSMDTLMEQTTAGWLASLLEFQLG